MSAVCTLSTSTKRNAVILTLLYLKSSRSYVSMSWNCRNGKKFACWVLSSEVRVVLECLCFTKWAKHGPNMSWEVVRLKDVFEKGLVDILGKLLQSPWIHGNLFEMFRIILVWYIRGWNSSDLLVEAGSFQSLELSVFFQAFQLNLILCLPPSKHHLQPQSISQPSPPSTQLAKRQYLSHRPFTEQVRRACIADFEETRS